MVRNVETKMMIALAELRVAVYIVVSPFTHNDWVTSHRIGLLCL
jgi:hypothetical protein